MGRTGAAWLRLGAGRSSASWAHQGAPRTHAAGRAHRRHVRDGRSRSEIERRWLGALGGVTFDPAFLWGWISSIYTCRDYPISAKLHYLTAMRCSMERLWGDMGRRVDLVWDSTKLAVPVHLFAGRADHIAPVELIQDWLAVLDAPTTRLEIVEDAGHLNLYERPARFIAFLEQL